MVPSTHIRWLTTACDSSSRDYDALHTDVVHTHPQRYTFIQYKQMFFKSWMLTPECWRTASQPAPAHTLSSQEQVMAPSQRRGRGRKQWQRFQGGSESLESKISLLGFCIYLANQSVPLYQEAFPATPVSSLPLLFLASFLPTSLPPPRPSRPSTKYLLCYI